MYSEFIEVIKNMVRKKGPLTDGNYGIRDLEYYEAENRKNPNTYSKEFIENFRVQLYGGKSITEDRLSVKGGRVKDGVFSKTAICPFCKVLKKSWRVSSEEKCDMCVECYGELHSITSDGEGVKA